jgi:hypothetical protein
MGLGMLGRELDDKMLDRLLRDNVTVFLFPLHEMRITLLDELLHLNDDSRGGAAVEPNAWLLPLLSRKPPP